VDRPDALSRAFQHENASYGGLRRTHDRRSQQDRLVPEISRFFGIVIRMFFDDHLPTHFHASYAAHEGRISISPIGVMTGCDLPPRSLALVVEWATLHQAELLENWQLARLGKPLASIAPLE
jgi:hypothetical protein